MQGKVEWILPVLKVMKDVAILGYEVLLSICFFTLISSRIFFPLSIDTNDSYEHGFFQIYQLSKTVLVL